jgi:hypothetical protein
MITNLRQLRLQLDSYFYHYFDVMESEQRLALQNIISMIDFYLKSTEDF